MLQGRFRLKKLNLLFVFQVNCPGCFLYGLPVVNDLFHKYKNEVGFLGLSTAFEDFEYNNKANTELLVQKKGIVGETQKALKQNGFESYPNEIDFPIAMDSNADESFDYESALRKICVLYPNYHSLSEHDKQTMEQSIINYLMSLEEISETFTLNQLRGTPSFILFNEQYDILEQWFGHKEPAQINALIDGLLKKQTA